EAGVNCPTANGKPTALRVIPDVIAGALKGLPQWVVWAYVDETDPETGEVDWDKPPLDARTGRAASSTNPKTWVDCPAALAAYTDPANGLDGLGFVLWIPPGETGAVLVAIDLDHCRDPETGDIAEWAWVIVQAINSYTEVSPSGCGIRIFLLGK